jgi:hypothetical protein
MELIVVFLAGLFLRDLLYYAVKTLKSKDNHRVSRRDFLYRDNEKEINHILRPVGYVFASNDEKSNYNYTATPLQDSSNPIDTA